MSETEAKAKASAMSVCIYSAAQHDQDKHPELVAYQLDEREEKAAIENFKDPEHPLKILIVCNAATGFDAPIEQAMYLDSPLSDHNLLQAIARTNCCFGHAKTCVAIVDYIGVSKNLGMVLAASTTRISQSDDR